MQGQLVSDWICVCTAGQAIDGRPVEEDWLLDAAERYDPNFYTALIWPYHTDDLKEREMFTPNYGIIAALKTEREDDLLKLYARLSPNQFLIEANKMSQKLFSSCEFWTDFQGLGYTYLFGIAATDIPASVGTGMMKFTVNNKELTLNYSPPVQFSIGKLQARREKEGLIDRIFASISQRKLSATKPEPAEELENMDELKELMQKLLEAVNGMKSAARGDTASTPDDAADEVREQAEEIVILAEELVDVAEDVAANPEDEVIAAEFSARRDELKELLKEYAAGNKQFAARRRRSLRAFSASRRTSATPAAQAKNNPPAGNMTTDQKMDYLLQQFAALSTSTPTGLPNPAPAGGDKEITVL